MRRAILLLVALCLCIGAVHASHSMRRTQQQQHARASAQQPPVDMTHISANATYFSVCLDGSGPAPAPAVKPLPSPIDMPVIDADASASAFVLVHGKHTECVAWGFHEDTIDTVGWSYFSVETNPAFSDYLQSRAAGFLEGALCQLRIYQTVEIQYPGFYPTAGPSPAVLTFLNDSITFHLGMFSSIGNVDPYWSQMANLYMQVQGVFEGYSAAVPAKMPEQALSWFHILSLQMDVDIGDITTAVGLHSPLATPEERAAAEAKIAAKMLSADEYTHCSVLVKPTPGNVDLIVGHATWSSYKTMIRTFKLYTMPLTVSIGSVTAHMSSYPGYLFSSDDWYQLKPSLLTVTETTNDIYNPALYALIEPGSVNLWARTLIANRLATSGAMWSELLSRYNSGTCNNQWIIVDHKLFVSGAHDFTPGLLTIAEQMPGMFVISDETHALATTGRWNSFNIPYFPRTYLTSGYQHCSSPMGSYVCGYYENFRYLLFNELQSSAVDLDSFRRVLMYNEFQTDPLQKGPNAAQYAIAARYDLRGQNPEAYGAIDGKITMDSWMKAQGTPLTVAAYSGPTVQTQKPFCWTGQWAAAQPKGMPTCFDFPWVTYAAPIKGEESIEAPAPVVAARSASPHVAAASSSLFAPSPSRSSLSSALLSLPPAFEDATFKLAMGVYYAAFYNYAVANPPKTTDETSLINFFKAWASGSGRMPMTAEINAITALEQYFARQASSSSTGGTPPPQSPAGKRLSLGAILGLIAAGIVVVAAIAWGVRKCCAGSSSSDQTEGLLVY